MAKIERDIKHVLTFDEAKTETNKIVANVKENFGSLINDIKWNADGTQADVSGKGFTGKFAITETNVKIFIELGFLTSAFKGKVEQKIDEYTQPLLKKKS